MRVKAAEPVKALKSRKQTRSRVKQERAEKLAAEKELEMRERRRKVVILKRKGASYHQIATELGISSQTAFSDVQAVLTEFREDALVVAPDLRALELARLDGWQLTLEDELLKVAANKPAVIGTLIRLSERRARLLGLDADDEIRRQVAMRQLVDMGEARRIVGEVLTALRAEASEDVLRRVQERVRASLYGTKAIDVAAGGENG